jgi:hypothetical protein
MRSLVRRCTGILVVAIVLGALVAAPTAHAAGSTSDEAQGQKLLERFLDALHPDADGEVDIAELKKFLSPAWTLQRANGTSSTKPEYLEAPALVESYEIQNLDVTRDGPVLVARYEVVVDSTINGQPQSSNPAPRLSVFFKGPKGWQMVAHANFNELVETPPTG